MALFWRGVAEQIKSKTKSTHFSTPFAWNAFLQAR